MHLDQKQRLAYANQALQEAADRLAEFVDNEKRQNSMAAALCKGLLADIALHRDVINIAIATITDASPKPETGR